MLPTKRFGLETKRVDGGIVVLVMSGRFMMGDCPRVDEEVAQHILRNEKSFIFDLAGVVYMDSGAVGQMVKSFTQLKKSGGTLRLSGVGGMVKGILKMTQLDRVIEIFPTPADAAQNFPQAQ